MINDCKICNSITTKLFSDKILNKYIIDYFQCDDCGFIQTENPYWLNESYSSVIAATDIGLVNRNISFQNITSWIINSYFDYNSKFLDYAGGYGLFVRLMRDKGYDFYRQDVYCENYFAKFFDIREQNAITKFELVTAFEVFEHLVNPIEEIAEIFESSDVIFFSTELQPQNQLNSTVDWWYFAAETGQHISFYNVKSLKIIAKKMNCDFYTNNTNLHIFTKRKLNSDPFLEWENSKRKHFIITSLYRIIRYIENRISKHSKRVYMKSLLNKDFEYVKTKINNK